jgi:energy-coupling factor transporter ATP-binding protein EcfA2
VLIGRWLLAESDVLLLFDITRGVDVGTKHDIYELMMELVAEGKSLLFYSSETEEMARLCHRVIVLREGSIAAELGGVETDAEAIVAAAASTGRPVIVQISQNTVAYHGALAPIAAAALAVAEAVCRGELDELAGRAAALDALPDRPAMRLLWKAIRVAATAERALPFVWRADAKSPKSGPD